MSDLTDRVSAALPWLFPRRQTAEIPPAVQQYLDAPRPDTYQPWRDIPYSVLDIETTGLNARHDAMLAIGLVNIDYGRVQLGRQWYSLLQPPKGTTIPPASIRIHGLLHCDVAQARPAEEVLPELLARLEGRVLVVHYAPIDIDFLNRALRELWGITLRGPAIDTVRLAQTLYHYERWTTGHDGENLVTALTPLAEQLGIPVHQQHHALGDAITTAMLFLAQANHMEQKGMHTLYKLLKGGRCLR